MNERELISREAAIRKAAETIYITCWPKDEEDAEVIISSITDILSRALPAAPAGEQMREVAYFLEPHFRGAMGRDMTVQEAIGLIKDGATERDELREALREYAEILHTERKHVLAPFDTCDFFTCVRARKLIETNP